MRMPGRTEAVGSGIGGIVRRFAPVWERYGDLRTERRPWT